MRIDVIGRRRLAVALAVGLTVVAMPGGVTAGGAVDKLPDLRMASLQQFHLQTTSTGRRLIRFETVIVNVGKGPFEVTARRACSSLTTCPKMAVRHVIYRSDGTKRSVAREGWMKYKGDGHDHWHVQRIEKYQFFRREPDSTFKRGAKVGFCFFDNVAYRLSLPDAPDHRVYGEGGCGVSSSLTTRVGQSVGWGDRYPWNFVFQWIDITGLPPGPYRVCVTTDQQDRYKEIDDTNNQVWQDVTLYSGGGLGVGGKGWAPCRNGIGSKAQQDAAEAADAAEDLPDQTAISGDEPGSVACRIPDGATPLAQGPGWCQAAPDGQGWLAPEGVGGPKNGSPISDAPAVQSPPRPTLLAPRAGELTCLI